MNHPLKILCAEDDTVSRMVLQSYFNNKGYISYVAEDGAEAFKIFQANAKNYDLVITDYDMPGLNGCELFYAIRYECKVIIPFVGMSAYSYDFIVQNEYSKNACDDAFEEISEIPKSFDSWLQKPIKFEDLDRAIHEAISETDRYKKSQSDDTLKYQKPNQ